MDTNFWERADELLEKDTWKNLCEKAGLKLGTIRHLRCDEKLPNLADADKIARYLNTTIDYLLNGEEEELLSSKEKEIIKNYHKSPTHIKVLVELALKDASTE